jgi:serine/threonine protein phosphatase PrpC
VNPEAQAASGSQCPACGEELVDRARFCEACGAATEPAGSAAVPAGVAPSGPVGTAGPVAPGPGAAGPGVAVECDRCAGAVASDGYCTRCGHRALEPITGEDRGALAYATHRGRRHHRNEDAAALANTGDGWPVLVVADGVSASPNPHRAAGAAVAAAAARLASRPFAGRDDLVAAVAAADDAACAVPADGDPSWQPDGTHPACTIVVSVATSAAVHVANVGDARAYLVRGIAGTWSASQLTSDDSFAAEAVAEGVDPSAALAGPAGHAITAWLGTDAPTLEPHVATHPADPGDLLLVCSDGLWNYAPTDDALGALLTATLPPPRAPVDLADVCQRLVSWAVDQGGSDNICVALTPLPAAGGNPHPTELEEES